MNNTAEK